MLHSGQSAHAGSNLSCADILTVLYYGILRVDPQCPAWPERDRFVMSKGHGAAALWATLAAKGFFPDGWLATYYKDDGYLPGHVTYGRIPGVEFSTGSLGHGLPFACGLALAAKRNGSSYRIFALISDGELDEGSNWEALLFAPHHNLVNLTVILDYNKLQGITSVSKTLELEPIAQKLTSFGWRVAEIDGHDCDAIDAALRVDQGAATEAPLFVIAHTIKGKGVSFMENNNDWHYLNLDDEQLMRARDEVQQMI